MTKPMKCSSKKEPLRMGFAVSTDQLICTGDGFKEGQWTYMMDLRVNEQQNYPDIPPSTWILTLHIGHKYKHAGQVVALVRPKENSPELKSPSGEDIIVDYRIRHCPGGVPADFLIGKSGYVSATDHDNLQSLADGTRKSHYSLRKGTHMLVVELFFYVKKRTVEADLRKIYETGLFTDCTLLCEGQEFPVHRAMLAVQSPVFAGMFRNEMKNKAKGFEGYWITDIRHDELAAIIKFVYTRSQLDEKVNLLQLSIAAHKYGMDDLRNACELEMIRDVKPASAFSYWSFAIDNNLVKLQAAAAKFLGGHPDGVQ